MAVSEQPRVLQDECQRVPAAGVRPEDFSAAQRVRPRVVLSGGPHHVAQPQPSPGGVVLSTVLNKLIVLAKNGQIRNW